MCGIFAYIGECERNSVNMVLEGIKKLEYRGYDSAGISGISGGRLIICKEVGKIAALEVKMRSCNINLDIAIAHTRWATHGQPTLLNAHPHTDEKQTVAVVHNGIIENHDSLRRKLMSQGVKFLSETDSEVIAHLIASHYNGDLLVAIQASMKELKGAYALAILHCDYPEEIFTAAYESTLAIGQGGKECFIASDPQAFTDYTLDAFFLQNSEIAVVKAGQCAIYDASMRLQERPPEKITALAAGSSRGGYQHYTLKEIHEQPAVIQRALEGRLSDEFSTAIFDEIGKHIDMLGVERILIVACGTSLYAGFVASYMFEDKARVPVQVEISSEFRYKNPIVQPGTLTIAISQSGETADTVAAVRELKRKGAKVLALCNVQGSTLTREADATLLLEAGAEIGVCSTKAFTCQLTLLTLLALYLARMRQMSKKQGAVMVSALRMLPRQVEQVLDSAFNIQAVAKKYAHYENFFFLGRNYLYPTSLEGALKLKEISYINANGYPAGEMKHGPIALISPECPTLAMCANHMTFDKLMSNLMEVKARQGRIIAIAAEGQDVTGVVDDLIQVPDTVDELAPILSAVAAQLFAYYVALERGTEIDQPRNLAKSVTVE